MFISRPTNDTVKGCYHRLSIDYSTFTFSAVAVLIYLIAIHPVFHSCIPRVSTTVKLLFSVFIFFTAVLVLLGIESTSYFLERGNHTAFKCVFQTDSTHPEIHIDVHWVIVSSILNGLSIFSFILSGTEFICAQAPFNMKGLVFGIACN